MPVGLRIRWVFPLRLDSFQTSSPWNANLQCSTDSGRAGAPLFEDVARRAAAYLKLVPERQVAPSTTDVDALQVLSTAFPELPIPPDEVIEWLDRVGSPATVATAGGRYFGFVNGGALPAAVAASWLVARGIRTRRCA